MAAASLWAWHPLLAGQIVLFDFAAVPLLVFAIYQWNRTRDLVEDRINAPRDAHRAELSTRAMRRTAILCFLMALTLSAATGSLVGAFALGLAAATGLAYSGVAQHGVRLKAHAAIKNLIPAAVWSGTVVVYPVLHTGAPLTGPVWLAALYTALVALRVEVAWDWRDARGDRRAGIDTWAARLGEGRVSWLLQGLGGAAATLVAAALLLGAVPAVWALTLVQCGGAALWIGSDLRNSDPPTWGHVLVAIDLVCAIAFGAIVRLGGTGPLI